MINKMILDATTISYQALNLFPYWDDDLLNQWDDEYLKIIKNINSKLSLKSFYKELMSFVSILNDGHSLIYLPKIIKE